MALAKPLNTNKKHGRKKWEGVAPWARRPQLSKAEPASLLSPSSPSLGPLFPLLDPSSTLPPPHVDCVR